MKTEGLLRKEMRQTPEGKLLLRYGFEPYETESCARRVAEKATLDIADLVAALEDMLAIVPYVENKDHAKLFNAREVLRRVKEGKQ